MVIDLQNFFTISNESGSRAIVFVATVYPDRRFRVDAALAIKNHNGEWVPTAQRISVALGDIDPEFNYPNNIYYDREYSEISEEEDKKRDENKIVEFPSRIKKSFEIAWDQNGEPHLVGVKEDGQNIDMGKESWRGIGSIPLPRSPGAAHRNGVTGTEYEDGLRPGLSPGNSVDSGDGSDIVTDQGGMYGDHGPENYNCLAQNGNGGSGRRIESIHPDIRTVGAAREGGRAANKGSGTAREQRRGITSKTSGENMKVDLQNPNPGRFFPWPGETEEEKAGITVRLLNQQAIRSFDEETVSEGDLRVIDGQLLRERVVDEVLREELRLDYCIVNWTGLQDEDGKEIPCTRENKVKLMHNDPQLSGFLENCFNKLQVEQKMRIMGK